VQLDDLVALKPWTEVGPFQAKALRGALYARDIKAGSPLNKQDIISPKKMQD
jgi:hypothetical protein